MPLVRSTVFAVSSAPLALASAKTLSNSLSLLLAKAYFLAASLPLALKISTRASSISKITRPVFAGLLPRLRLFRLIDKGLRGPVLWVGGPPGCGKTSLVSGFVSARRRRCLWYRVDAGDADAPSFSHYLQLAADA